MKINLEPWEWDMVDALAKAEGVDRQTIIHDLIMEGAMYELELHDVSDACPPKVVH